MGLFSFLFDPQDKVTVQFEMPRKQYESLQFLIDSAKTIRPDYDHSTLLCNLVEEFIKRNLGTVTKRMVDIDKQDKREKKRRVRY